MAFGLLGQQAVRTIVDAFGLALACAVADLGLDLAGELAPNRYSDDFGQDRRRHEVDVIELELEVDAVLHLGGDTIDRAIAEIDPGAHRQGEQQKRQ